MSDDECPICIGSLTPSKRVECPFCAYAACKSCQQRFILDDPRDPRCMSCGKFWDRETLTRLFSKSFCAGSLKRHREDVLMDRERSLLPATQPLVEQELRRREARTRAQQLREDCARLMRELSDARHELWVQQRVAQGRDETLPESRTFMHKCPNADCRGFLSTAWKCSICKLYTCPECNEVKGEERDAPGHVCDPRSVESMQAIRRDCKPCPNCATPIHRVHGCDQMWCTQCHTPFSWRTLSILRNAVVHNPHFYQWQQANPGRANPGDPNGVDECGGRLLLSYRQLAAAVASATDRPTHGREVYAIHRLLVHAQHEELGRLQGRQLEMQNSDLRIRYLLRELSDEEWKVELQRREKKAEKNRDLTLLLTMFVQTGSDTLRNHLEAPPPVVLAKAVEEMHALRVYANEQFKLISRRYACVGMCIPEDWREFERTK